MTKQKEVEVWPENWPAFNLFCSLESDWIFAGMGQRCGLQRLVVFARLDRMGLSREDWDHMEADIRVMELAALEKLNEKE